MIIMMIEESSTTITGTMLPCLVGEELDNNGSPTDVVVGVVAVGTLGFDAGVGDDVTVEREHESLSNPSPSTQYFHSLVNPQVIKQASCFLQESSQTCGTPYKKNRNKHDTI